VVPPLNVKVLDMEALQEQVLMRDDTLSQSPGLAMTRAQSEILKRDFEDYVKATIEDVARLMVHSLMRVSILIWLISLYPIFVCLNNFCFRL
jgi:hypothetical protein